MYKSFNLNSFLLKVLFKCSQCIPAKLYISIQNRLILGKKINWRHPILFSDKLQWLKLHDHNPLYSNLVDKVAVKGYVSKLIGDEYVIPTLGVYTKGEDIPWDQLPSKFVLKCNHDGGSNSVVLCKNKKLLDKTLVIKKLNNRLRINNYWHTKEWPYKHIVPRILAEQMLQTASEMIPEDYKFYCFNGEPKLLLVIRGRETDMQYCYFDMEFKLLPIMDRGKTLPTEIPCKPHNFEKMLEIVRKLAVGIPHVRIDLYNVDGNIYFGEYTFYSAGGFEFFEPYQWNLVLGDWLNITNIK